MPFFTKEPSNCHNPIQRKYQQNYLIRSYPYYAQFIFCKIRFIVENNSKVKIQTVLSPKDNSSSKISCWAANVVFNEGIISSSINWGRGLAGAFAAAFGFAAAAGGLSPVFSVLATFFSFVSAATDSRTNLIKLAEFYINTTNHLSWYHSAFYLWML